MFGFSQIFRFFLFFLICSNLLGVSVVDVAVVRAIAIVFLVVCMLGVVDIEFHDAFPQLPSYPAAPGYQGGVERLLWLRQISSMEGRWHMGPSG